MEFKARYLVTAIFTIFVTSMAFVFVYWLANFGGTKSRSQYWVHYPVAVTSLVTGSKVTYNGLEVGEVSSLGLDEKLHSGLAALVEIDRDIPIRSDTKAGIEFQGLTGVANVALSGGGNSSEPISKTEYGIPVIVADPELSRNWTQSANLALNAINNLFSNNKQKFEAIISGLENLTGGKSSSANLAYFDLALPTNLTLPAELPNWQLAISEPTILLSRNTDRLQRLEKDNSITSIPNVAWTDNLPNLFQTKIVQAFENAGLGSVALRSSQAFGPTYKMEIDIRHFQYDISSSPKVSIDLVVKILHSDGAVLDMRRFQADTRLSTDQVTSIVSAMSNLFAQTSQELILWTLASLPPN